MNSIIDHQRDKEDFSSLPGIKVRYDLNENRDPGSLEWQLNPFDGCYYLVLKTEALSPVQYTKYCLGMPPYNGLQYL